MKLPTPSRKRVSRMQSWFTIMGQVLIVLFAFQVGFAVAHHWWFNAVLNGLLGVFWVGFEVIFWLDRFNDGALSVLYKVKDLIDEVEKDNAKKTAKKS